MYQEMVQAPNERKVVDPAAWIDIDAPRRTSVAPLMHEGNTMLIRPRPVCQRRLERRIEQTWSVLHAFPRKRKNLCTSPRIVSADLHVKSMRAPMLSQRQDGGEDVTSAE